MGKILGIDLGTSTSEVSVFLNGKSIVLKNEFGDLIIPSVVGLDEENNIIVGRKAKDQMLNKPNETVLEVKRLMGKDVNLKMGDKEYKPQEISSFILKYLYDMAKAQLDFEIDGVVITVPAYFSDEQRRATYEAGKLAGLKVERIINEPTAAALDYGINNMTDCNNIMVYDLGGGTLDVTILEMFDGVLAVKSSCGNNMLGGKDFDSKIIDYISEKYFEKYNTEIPDDPKALMRLKESSENCKIYLSKESEYNISLPFFATINDQPVSIEENITREIFEKLIYDQVYSTKNQINLALEDANLKINDIEMILLVGGSTKIPLVKRFIKDLFNKEAKVLIDPDLAVVSGAAIQGAIINKELDANKDIVITDVCPYTLGMGVIEYIAGMPVPDVLDVIIPRNVTIPTTKEKIYGTVFDNQEEVDIIIYQGENRKASKNNFLGNFRLSGIPKAIANEEKIKVTFSYDLNGILSVEGIVMSTNNKMSLRIETSSVDMNGEIDVSGWSDIPKSRKYRSVINRAEKLIYNNEAYQYVVELESLVNSMKIGLIAGDEDEDLNEIRDKLVGLIYEITEGNYD